MKNGPKGCVFVCKSRPLLRLVSVILRGRAEGGVCCWGRECHWSVRVVEVKK